MQTQCWTELATEALSAGARRILLWGPSGTGKSTWPFWDKITSPEKISLLPCRREMDDSEILGQWEITGGDTVFSPGPFPRALRDGGLLLLDEIGRHHPRLEALLLQVLNDRDALRVTLPDGRTYSFNCNPVLVIGTTNTPASEFASACPALFDRWDCIICADSPTKGACDSLGDPVLATMAKASAMAQVQDKSWGRGVTLRTATAFQNLVKGGLAPDRAAPLVFGSYAPEFFSAYQTAKNS